MNNLIASILNWIAINCIIPLIKIIRDNSKISQKISDDKKIVEELKNAESSADIDRAIDNIP